MAIYNPFVGNYIMDAMTTEPFGELTIQSNGLLAVVGVSNGKLNQSVAVSEDADNQPTIYAKLGYDKMMNDDLRFRLTASVINNNGRDNGTYIFGGDRAGTRYYKVLNTAASASDFDGRYNPRFKQTTAIQVNPFVQFMGLEFFGLYEIVMDGTDVDKGGNGGSITQIGAELIYRISDFYIGGRYNSVSGNATETSDDINISRINIGGGWFMLNNVVTKLEYTTQTYSGDGYNGTKWEEATFGGINLEAVISF
jgi:hypothetical protein